jgi:hypothetical protein
VPLLGILSYSSVSHFVRPPFSASLSIEVSSLSIITTSVGSWQTYRFAMNHPAEIE